MSSADVDDLVRAFTEETGRAPTGVWASPGRVNLIGEHTDYNDGFVMPFALEQRVLVAAAPRDRRRLAGAVGQRVEHRNLHRADLEPGMEGWQAYVAGVVWVLRRGGHEIAGADLVLSSDVPIGAGLSSSAALECATLATWPTSTIC